MSNQKITLQLASIVVELIKEVEDKQVETDKLRKDNSCFEKLLDKVKHAQSTDIENSKQENQRLTDKLKLTQSKVVSATDENVVLHKKIDELRYNKTIIREQNEELKEKNRVLGIEKDGLTLECKALRVANIDLKKDNETLREKSEINIQLKNDVDNLRVQYQRSLEILQDFILENDLKIPSLPLIRYPK